MLDTQKVLSNLRIEKTSSIHRISEAGTVCPSFPRLMKKILDLSVISADSVASEIN